MNRLTKRNGHYCDDCGYEPGEFCACNEEIAMYERLKQYEDAEEEGRSVGHWIDMGDFISCSICHETRLKEFEFNYNKVKRLEVYPNYCPNCGAKMDGGKDA